MVVKNHSSFSVQYIWLPLLPSRVASHDGVEREWLVMMLMFTTVLNKIILLLFSFWYSVFQSQTLSVVFLVFYRYVNTACWLSRPGDEVCTVHKCCMSIDKIRKIVCVLKQVFTVQSFPGYIQSAKTLLDMERFAFSVSGNSSLLQFLNDEAEKVKLK